ncbi:MAG: hypothetical protein JWO90_673 [Solirubrobacterales bacterium]|nr:hypothetical protein [Solirubrobacterales bacterium]
MRHLLPLATVLAALALPGSAAAAALPALGVAVASCETGPGVGDRAVGFGATMPGAPGASVLAVRFTLEQRRGSGGWKTLRVRGWERYERSADDATGFVYQKRVERLAPGAWYRVVVRFRWTGAGGRLVKRATRTSRACRQPDLRPDLAVLSVTPEVLAPDRTRYVVRVRNLARTAVQGPVRVGLAVDGVPLGTEGVPLLTAGATADVVFEGPACLPGGSLRAAVDPDDDLEEAREADNVLSLACPG